MESSEVLAAKLLEFMGGKENIISVTHCATRLRPQLKDRSLVDADAIEKLDGVTGLVNKDSGLQIIIGMSVGDIYKAFMKVWDSERLEREGLIEKEEAGPKRHEGGLLERTLFCHPQKSGGSHRRCPQSGRGQGVEGFPGDLFSGEKPALYYGRFRGQGLSECDRDDSTPCKAYYHYRNTG